MPSPIRTYCWFCKAHGRLCATCNAYRQDLHGQVPKGMPQLSRQLSKTRQRRRVLPLIPQHYLSTCPVDPVITCAIKYAARASISAMLVSNACFGQSAQITTLSGCTTCVFAIANGHCQASKYSCRCFRFTVCRRSPAVAKTTFRR